MLASTQTTLSAELSFVQAGGLDFGWRKSSSEEAGKGLLITAANTEGWGWGCEWTMPVQGGRQEGAAGVIPNTGLAGNDQDPPPINDQNFEILWKGVSEVKMYCYTCCVTSPTLRAGLLASSHTGVEFCSSLYESTQDRETRAAG